MTDSPLIDDYHRVRSATLAFLDTLQTEDTVVQSMPDVSPTKWHLAHVTWFFERFVLEHFDANYRRCDEAYDYLFNSYYYSVGKMHPRPQRGLLTRPTLDEVVKAQLGLTADRGVVIIGVKRNSPAERCDLRPHDIVLSFGGVEVSDLQTFKRLVLDSAPGRAVSVEIQRSGDRMTVDITPARRGPPVPLPSSEEEKKQD